MSNSFKLYPTHFSRGGEIFSSGTFAPLVTGLSRKPTYRVQVGGPVEKMLAVETLSATSKRSIVQPQTVTPSTTRL